MHYDVEIWAVMANRGDQYPNMRIQGEFMHDEWHHMITTVDNEEETMRSHRNCRVSEYCFNLDTTGTRIAVPRWMRLS